MTFNKYEPPSMIKVWHLVSNSRNKILARCYTASERDFIEFVFWSLAVTIIGITYFRSSIFTYTLSLRNDFFKSTAILFYTDIVSLFHSHFVHNALESTTFLLIPKVNSSAIEIFNFNGINVNQFLSYGCLYTFPRVI